jgi:zinc finger protein 830
MADVRALLAAERQSRRITHPHLTYTKTNALICNICNLNVKSEKLWEGHLRSLNHRKNAQKTAAAQEPTKNNKKRKLDDVNEEHDDEERIQQTEMDRRKMPKSRVTSRAEKEEEIQVETDTAVPNVPPIPPQSEVQERTPMSPPSAAANPTPAASADALLNEAQQSTTQNQVDEDEFAAFEREIASLDQPPAALTDYTAATITAAPLSAEELAAQSAAEKKKTAEILAEDEEDEEKGRLEEEFEIMEEFEERVRRLRERREEIRAGAGAGGEGIGGAMVIDDEALTEEEAKKALDNAYEVPAGDSDGGKDQRGEDDDDDDDEEDDWYA